MSEIVIRPKKDKKKEDDKKKGKKKGDDFNKKKKKGKSKKKKSKKHHKKNSTYSLDLISRQYPKEIMDTEKKIYRQHKRWSLVRNFFNAIKFNFNASVDVKIPDDKLVNTIDKITDAAITVISSRFEKKEK